jgi:hypothetical protein
MVDGHCVGRGRGNTKKAAKNEAAKEGLVKMGVPFVGPTRLWFAACSDLGFTEFLCRRLNAYITAGFETRYAHERPQGDE